LSDLKGQIALVTGANRGIGRAIALELASRGATVVGTATSKAGAGEITDRFRQLNLTGEGKVLDVTDREAVDMVIGSATQQGPVTILVNNAGITRDGLLLRMKDDDWDRLLDTNLGSVFRMTRGCLRGMVKARFGRIINIASVVGLTGNPGQSNYAAAKAGMIAFTKSLAREVGGRGITVNAVAPGFIDTDMTRALDEGQRQALLDEIPLSRLGMPEEVAKAVGFLASSEAGYITGETLHVNGGLYMP
jgi:3-oxoacyl-[acyl-carrier protein] reductase